GAYAGEGAGVVGRSADGKICYKPFVIRLDDADSVRELWTMAQEGAKYRGQLLYDLVRFGNITQGKDFDREFHLSIARAMSVERLEKFVETWRKQANERMRTNPVEDKNVSEFDGGSVKARQTVAKGPHATRTNGRDNSANPI